jgi:hypothetical protein
MTSVDINIEERGLILQYLVAYLGLHSKDLSEVEREKLEKIINKIESIPI